MKISEFLKSQKILRLATVNGKGIPHIVPVWYNYKNNKFYIGTNTRTKKIKNIRKNPRISFCIDIGIRSPEIFGVMGTAKAELILEKNLVIIIAKKILLRYYDNLENKSAQQLLADTDCIIEIIPDKIKVWKF